MRADAEAICEAMSRPTMRFVPVKTTEQQAALMLAGARDGLIARRTQLSNTIRGYAAEFGLTTAKGLDKIEPLLARIAASAELPKLAKELFAVYGRDYAQLQRQIMKIEARLMAWHKDNELSRRLVEVPTIGPIGATLLAMKVDQSAYIPLWPGLLRLDRADAEGSLDSRQDEARCDHPRRRRGIAKRAGGRRHGGDPAGAEGTRIFPALAGRASQTQAA